jgi:uncharacterized membrane protein
LAAALSLATALFSYRYLAPSAPLVPPNVAGNAYAAIVLPVHAVSAATALLLGPLQFWRSLRSRRPRAHRLVGRLYVLACMLGGASGFVLALGSTAGPIAGAGFATLALAWIYVTGRGVRLAVQGRYDEHRRWMIRSFALTFAAVTLRLLLILAPAAPIGSTDAYRAIAWLCWVPNLLIVEACFAWAAPRFVRLEKA